MYVDEQHQRLFIKAKDPQRVIAALPNFAEPVNWRGHNVVVDHNEDVTKVLRNLGLRRAPAPIRYYYDFPRPPHIAEPFEHQVATAEFLTIHRAGFVLNEMGTGKTASALWAADYLMRLGFVKRALIIAPLSSLERVWRDEIFSFLMQRVAVVLHGPREQRFERLASKVGFYITNFDGVEILGKEIRKRKDIDLFIIDEAAAYRNTDTDRYRLLEEMLPERPRLWLMTGTPCPHRPDDAWGLTRLVNKAKVPMFKSTFTKKTMIKVSQHKWRPREGWQEIVYGVMQPGIRFTKKECLDLPPVTYEDRDVELTPEQVKAFRQMQQHMMMFAENYEIDAVNAADKIGKLRQICLGSVKDPDSGDYVVLPHRPRLNVLLECIEQASAKVLVIVPYKGITRVLYEEVRKHYSTVIVNGDVTPKRRNEIWADFKHKKDPHTALCHPQVMAHALTLTEADMLVFYGPIYSNEFYVQVMDRINRLGQTRPMTIVRMGANPVEWEIYRMVEGKRFSQEDLLALYQTALQS